MLTIWNSSLPTRKRTVFLGLLAIAAAIGLILSEIASTIRNWSADHEAIILVAVPESGSDRVVGRSIRNGIDLSVRQLNQAGGLAGLPVRAVLIDEARPEALERAFAEQIEHTNVVGAIGYWHNEALAAALPVLQAHNLPVISLAGTEIGSGSAGAPPVSAPRDVLRLAVPAQSEISFLANYVRNILGEKTVAVIYEKGAAGETAVTAFDEVLQRFASRLVFRWDFDPNGPDGARLAEIASTVRERMPVGTVAILAAPAAAAKAVAALRQAGVRNRVVGPSALAAAAFLNEVAAGTPDVDATVNGVVATTALLFDTANAQGQKFREAYHTAFQTTPDWVSATAFEAVRLLFNRIPRSALHGSAPAGSELRRIVSETVNDFGHRPGQADGALGTLFFDGKGSGAPPPLVGIYDGSSLIAAPTQLSPILEKNVGSYLDELAAGRALFVNDRFMYKTNVTYVGLYPHNATGFDLASRTVSLDFHIWFRWRGEFDPQDVIFINAVTPIKLEAPEKDGKVGDIRYRSYRVKGTFFIDYSNIEHPFGTHVIGVSFRHRVLNRNNLMYVDDILGMRLGDPTSPLVGERPAGGGEDWKDRIRSLFRGLTTSADPLTRNLIAGRVLAGIPGWDIRRAWISQDVVEASSNGDPFFVGFGKPLPMFSHLDLGMIVKPDELQARDLISSRYYLYIAIFAFCGSILASLLDGRDRGQFWRLQTLGLRLVCWPMLLTSVGNMALDYGQEAFSNGTVELIALFYQALWWLVPSRLLVTTLERFLWQPLELRSGRKIPNVVRLLAATLIYLFAIFGIVAFVMGKTIVSLLATSGVMAMVIGLAIQANIANVFSGIVLNIERPFKVGDFIRIGNVMGQVVDITWRTTRIRSEDGQLVCLANGKVSESELHNLSDLEGVAGKLVVHIDPEHDPEKVLTLIRGCLVDLPEYAKGPPDQELPKARFSGVECVGGFWVAVYVVKMPLKHMGRRKHVVEQIWRRLWARLLEAGITWPQPLTDQPPPPAPRPTPA